MNIDRISQARATYLSTHQSKTRVPEGKAMVWYMTEAFWARRAIDRTVDIDPNNLGKTHCPLCYVPVEPHMVVMPTEDMLDGIWIGLQGENWSPDDEASEFIRSLGLIHTSMSVGDVIQYAGKTYVVDSDGFKELA